MDSKRWIVVAKRLLGILTIEPDDLLREATLRILTGQRQLNRSVPIEVNLFGVMRSIASSWHKRRKRKPLKGTELATFADLNASQLATVQRLISRRLAGYRRDE